MTDRQFEYIRQLQEKNRLKKMMNEKTEQQLQQEELERGFTTHFRGAHQSKEVTSTGPKSSTKPTVIKSAKAPAMDDIVQRLQPRSESYSRENASNSSQSNRYRNGEMWNTQGTSLPGSDQPSHSPERASTMPLPILDNIQSMSKEQKLVLLQLLQDSINSDSSPQPAVSSVVSDPNIEMEEKQTPRDDRLYQNNQDSTPRMAHHSDQAIASNEPTTDSLTPSAKPLAIISAPAVKHGMSIKLKIFSTLMDTKHLTLRGLRIRYYFPLQSPARPDPIPSSACYSPQNLVGLQYIDLIHRFSCKLTQGLEAVRQTAEVMSGLKVLLGSAPSSSAAFKISLPSYSSLEILLECEDIEQLIISQLNHNNYHSVKALELRNLKLALWNGDSHDRGISSGGRDVEISVDGKSLFNGELKEGVDGDICRSNDFLNHIFMKEATPSLVVDVVQSGQPPPLSAAQNTRINPEDAHSDLQRPEVAQMQPAPRVEPIPRAEEELVKPGSAKPDWLSTGGKAMHVHDDLFAPSSPVRTASRKGRRGSADSAPIVEASMEIPVVLDDQLKKIESPKRMLKGRRRGQTRSTGNLLDGESVGVTKSASITPLAPAQGFGQAISPLAVEKEGGKGLPVIVYCLRSIVVYVYCLLAL